jgi:tetratricopeptide (TPR) repeat protein
VVATKVSAAQFSERFEREAKAIAALNHPNICQIYDIGPNYLVMEYINGAPIVSSEKSEALPSAEALRLATQFAAALEAAHAKGIPTFWCNPCFLGRAYEQKGKLPEAIAEFQSALALDKNTEIWSGLGHAYAPSGNTVEAQKVIEHLKDLSAHSYVSPYSLAVIYAGLGEKYKAFEWLERAYQERSYFMAVYLITDARLDSLHADPRFEDLRRRVGLPK